MAGKASSEVDRERVQKWGSDLESMASAGVVSTSPPFLLWRASRICAAVVQTKNLLEADVSRAKALVSVPATNEVSVRTVGVLGQRATLQM